MITGQIIQNSIEDLHQITKVDFCVYDMEGIKVASTFEPDVEESIIEAFAESAAESQVIGSFHLLKAFDGRDVAYVVVAKGASDDVYMIGKIAVSQIQALIVAYKERFDRNNFFQNLMLDNLLLVDIYNRAKKLRIEVTAPRVVFIIENKSDRDNSALEILKSMYSEQSGDYLTAVDEKNIILIKKVEENDTNEDFVNIAKSVVDLMNTEAMMSVRVSFGTRVEELKDVSKSYKEAKLALDVGGIFYVEKDVISYATLGIGRLIYQLPENLCKIFIDEIFSNTKPENIDEEILSTVAKFFENNLNVSETSRKLFVHRNTRVYRIEKLEKETGLDVRTFEDALTFKIALMVVNYLKYLESLK